MSQGLRRLVVATTAALVLLGGVTYVMARPTQYKSEAQLVLHLGRVSPGSVASYLDGFDRSSIAGTFVEHVSSDSTLRGAGSPPVDIKARAVPDTRVIDIEAVGPRGRVRNGLAAVIREAQSTQSQLRDPFRLGVLSPPTRAVVAGPPDLVLLLATALLAGLAGLFVFVVTRGPQSPSLRVAGEEAAESPPTRAAAAGR